MDLKTVLLEVRSWPAGDRLRLVEQVLDGLSEEGIEADLTEDLKDLLDSACCARGPSQQARSQGLAVERLTDRTH